MFLSQMMDHVLETDLEVSEISSGSHIQRFEGIFFYLSLSKSIDIKKVSNQIPAQ